MEKRGAKYHRERLGEALREEIETIVEGELGDPRIGLVSVTSVVLAEDSRSAQVFVTVDGDDDEAERSLEGLDRGSRIYSSRGGGKLAPASSSGIVFSPGPLRPVRRQNRRVAGTDAEEEEK